MNNKTKKVVVWAFIISISIFSVTSVNSSIEKANNHQQDDIKQLKNIPSKTL
jgi:hypothetical protein